ncbi:MAG: hypothetical protein ACYSVY_26505, partial [Planctomycetota bacterium]
MQEQTRCPGAFGKEMTHQPDALAALRRIRLASLDVKAPHFIGPLLGYLLNLPERDRLCTSYMAAIHE